MSRAWRRQPSESQCQPVSWAFVPSKNPNYSPWAVESCPSAGFVENEQRRIVSAVLDRLSRVGLKGTGDQVASVAVPGVRPATGRWAWNFECEAKAMA
jgi:hypothetical protein